MPQERYGKPIILTRTERDLIVKKEIKNRKLDRVRDLFVFQCFTGCRVGDMMNLKKVNLTDGVLTYLPGKTKGERPEAVRVPLASPALEIIEKYSFKEDDFLLPVMSAQKYNDYLRELFEFLEMDRRVLNNGKLVPLYKTVSSHLARRTFIGLLHKEVKDSVIASMSGHVKGSKAFNRYFDIDDDDRRGAIDLL